MAARVAKKPVRRKLASYDRSARVHSGPNAKISAVRRLSNAVSGKAKLFR